MINGQVIVDDGQITTIDMQPVIAEHNRHAAQMAAGGS